MEIPELETSHHFLDFIEADELDDDLSASSSASSESEGESDGEGGRRSKKKKTKKKSGSEDESSDSDSDEDDGSSGPPPAWYLMPCQPCVRDGKKGTSKGFFEVLLYKPNPKTLP